jgi:hypothetical protein
LGRDERRPSCCRAKRSSLTAEAGIAATVQRAPAIRTQTARWFEMEGVMPEADARLNVNLVV